MKKISVLMGVYNCASTLAEAIESLIAQTYTNWELIMCDDGSTDDTYEVASEYKKLYPDRIILLKNSQNMGLNYTLNRCLKNAKGEYIARMDGDDISLPNRFKREIEILENEDGIAFVSTDMDFFDENGVFGKISHPEYPKCSDFMIENPFCHAPCMVRREAFEVVGGYSVDKKLLRVEDYHLWVKMYEKKMKGKNINETHYQMRDNRNAYKRRKFKYRINNAYVRILAVKKLKLPVWMIVFAMRPIVTGLLPEPLYRYLHKKRLSS